jgi:hypothetical protein
MKKIPERSFNKHLCWSQEHKDNEKNLLGKSRKLEIELKKNDLLGVILCLNDVNLAMKMVVQIMEMETIANEQYTKAEKGNEGAISCSIAAMHYVNARDSITGQTGAEIFSLKWPQLWNEIMGEKNFRASKDFCLQYYGDKYIAKNGMTWCAYVFYVYYGGLEDFWKRWEESHPKTR